MTTAPSKGVELHLYVRVTHPQAGLRFPLVQKQEEWYVGKIPCAILGHKIFSDDRQM